MKLGDLESILPVLDQVMISFVKATQRGQLRPGKFCQWMEEETVKSKTYKIEEEGEN